MAKKQCKTNIRTIYTSKWNKL